MKSEHSGSFLWRHYVNLLQICLRLAFVYADDIWRS
jgi:hypothetical protein